MTVRCAINGCTAETAQDVGSAWICSTHWRRHCPPRSLRRRTYHRFFREAKKHGWDYNGPKGTSQELRWRYWKFWEMLVRLANAAEARADFEAAEINKINTMFGWNDD